LILLATPAGFEQENKNQHLVCPTAPKRAFARKGQFSKLSNSLRRRRRMHIAARSVPNREGALNAAAADKAASGGTMPDPFGCVAEKFCHRQISADFLSLGVCWMTKERVQRSRITVEVDPAVRAFLEAGRRKRGGG
jgi:hypothetical protein